MALTKDAGRQSILSIYVPFTYLTLEANAVVTAKVIVGPDIPANSIVVGGDVVVTTAFVGPTAAQLDVGDGGSTARYLTNANLLAAARTPIVPTGFKYAESDTIDFIVDTTVAAASAGAGYVRLDYIAVDRVTENV